MLVDDVFSKIGCGVVANMEKTRQDIGVVTNRSHHNRRLPSLAFDAFKKMWKPPWKPPAPWHANKYRHHQLISPNLPGFKKNNAIFILIYFGLIFTFLLSSANCNLSSASTVDSTSTSTAASSATSTTSSTSTTTTTTTTTSTNTAGHVYSGDGIEEGGEILEEDYLKEEADGTAESESRLHRALFENYAKDARPAKISNVSMHLQLISLDDVQAESGTIILTVQIWMTWRDLRFRWSPSNYSGVVNLQILPVDRIWFPMFWIRNSAQPDIQNSFWSHFPAFIGWTGAVSWVSSGKVTVACDLDFFYYPSDSQTCAIQFAAHDSYHINLTTRDEQRPICFDRYTNNSLWEITGVRAVPSGVTVHRTTEFLGLELRLRRRPLTDILRVFLPTACLAIVSLIAFLLPPDSGDKLNVTFTTMMAFFVMFLAITEMVPFTAEHTPVMAYFVVSTLLLSTIETIICSVIMTISDTEKAKDAAASAAACEVSSRKSSQLLQQIHQLTKATIAERRSSVLGYSMSENGEPGVGNGLPCGDNDENMRPRCNSNTTLASNATSDSGLMEFGDADAAFITSLKNINKQRRNSSLSSAVLIDGNRSVDFLRQKKTFRRRFAIFVIKLWQSFMSLFRNGKNKGESTQQDEDILLSRGLISSRRLNLLSFFIFGVLKIIIISLVSVILYDQSRQEDVESKGFHRPEYSNCWR